jgi:ubiquitin-conjugating enzyme E2 N
MVDSKKRILQEIREINRKQVEGVTYQVDDNNTRLFYGIIDGPVDTPYEGGKFKIQVFLPEGYPQTCPQAKFKLLFIIQILIQWDKSVIHC